MTGPNRTNASTFDLEGWYRRPAADPKAITALIASGPIEWPKEYLDLLEISNGGEGPLAVDPGWFSLWTAEEVLQLNLDYQVERGAPGFVGFGSDGGPELLAFNARRGPPYRVVMIPFGDIAIEEARPVAKDFASFLKAAGRAKG
ncbi:MAG: hypothetical protein BGO49_13185 [Planctomycetales bacterium 71-10]|nr:MAG: hypothetical protein BGO49_13185 [Planctomycetales bacterium 71-10]